MDKSHWLPARLSQQERLHRLGYLAIALLPIMGSYAFNQGLTPAFWGCPLLRLTGIPCPGWGLTRSFMAVARGDWQQAIAFHAFGIVLFGGFAIAAVHLALELIRDRRIAVFYVPMVRHPKFQIFVFLVLLSYHGIRLYDLAQAGELLTSFLHSPLGHGLRHGSM
ncbi:MAG: DUF2752 domain-containing protein [Leptolyngbyaceae cyanobacterium CRU_2_3]|nr:DUF2752 domain-containing protein [Leptolyngbyaceae cyanobacterium CRU_2_3]